MSSSKRLALVVGVIAVAIMVEAVVNVFVPRGQAPHQNWNFPASVPVLSVGSDFRIFVTAAQTMLEGESPLHENYHSPPFTAAVFSPFIPLSETTAYRIQFYLTIVENGAALIILASLAGSFLGTAEKSPEQVALMGVSLLAVTAFQFFGYPLEFALERGNYDSLALLMMCIGIWFAVRPGTGTWLPILFLSVAVHLKVYPAILLGIPLWRYRWRAVVPILVVNFGLLFCFGIPRGVEFLEGLWSYSKKPYLWMGNHSAVSFSATVLEPILKSCGTQSFAHVVALVLTLGVSLGLWLDGTIRLLRNGFSPRNAILGFALSTPLMCVVPSFSNDYKLVILAIPALLCLLAYADGYVSEGAWKSLAGLVATLICLIAVAQSVLFPSFFFTANKYPAVFALLGLMRGVLPRKNVFLDFK